jgi:hypothetical protein
MLYYIPSSISLCFCSENQKQYILKLPIITCDKHVYLLLIHDYKYYHISMYNLSVFFYEIQWNNKKKPINYTLKCDNICNHVLTINIHVYHMW